MYFLFLLLIIVCYFVCYRHYKDEKRQKNSFLLCCFFIMIYMQWFRDVSIYPDIGEYEQVFERTKNKLSIGSLSLFDGGYETGWVVLNLLFSLFSDDFDSFLKFIGLLVCCGYIYATYQYSKNPLFSILFILIYPSAFGMSFYVLKQSLAFSIILFAIHYLKEENPYKYFISIIFSVCFHYSAIIFVLLYWIAKKLRKGISIKFMAYLFVFILIEIILIKYIQLEDLLGDKYNGYLIPGGNLLPLILVSFITIIMIKNNRIIRKYEYQNQVYSKSEYSYIIFSYCILGVLVCIGIYGTKMDRMALYFTNFLAFSVPVASSTLPPVQSKLLRYIYLITSILWVLLTDSYCDIKHFSVI